MRHEGLVGVVRVAKEVAVEESAGSVRIVETDAERIAKGFGHHG
jgi:hypothetical protein